MVNAKTRGLHAKPSPVPAQLSPNRCFKNTTTPVSTAFASRTSVAPIEGTGCVRESQQGRGRPVDTTGRGGSRQTFSNRPDPGTPREGPGLPAATPPAPAVPLSQGWAPSPLSAEELE